MKRSLLKAVLVFVGFLQVSFALDFSGIHGLIQRRLPQHTEYFTFGQLPGSGDRYIIGDTEGITGGITISCTSLSACSRGLYVYLTDFGNVDIWWTGSRLDQLELPPLPVGTPVSGEAIVPFRYHFNTVTFGYTTAFWDFDKWSLLLDWLALRGVNIPLAWIGYEHILIEVYREVGLSDAEIADFMSGPAFLPWNRFGNIQTSWGGDLPMQWVEDQFFLGKQIVGRMAELGMTPVLPAFTGFVPRAFASHFPNASVVNGSQWIPTFDFKRTNDSFLEPFDLMFSAMQKSFLQKQKDAFGNVSHIYTLDQYNENLPFSGNLTYLHDVSSGTFASLRAVDPQAVWMMQGWLFFLQADFWTNDRIESYLSGVEGNDTMIILDLYSENQPQWNRTNNYFGKQWVWCHLHGLGGTMGLEGNLEELTNGPIDALRSPGSSMKGMGSTMEGQEGNELVYDALLDQAWSSEPLDIPDYVDNWTVRRYLDREVPSAAREAWQILSSTVYNNTDPDVPAVMKGILEFRPALTGLYNLTSLIPTMIPYHTNSTLIPEYRYDVLSVARQLLSNRFNDLYLDLVTQFNSSSTSPKDISTRGSRMINLLKDLDRLLYTNENFLFSTWIADALQWAGSNSSYATYLEYNARNQLTLWGPDGEINDYASKQWAGLVGEYYVKRWEMFLDYLVDLKGSGESYNDTVIAQQLLDFGKAWDVERWGNGEDETFGTRGDTLQVASEVLNIWG
ncbi:hypothetical protein QCA50_002443 [Cerrena zonata]|uniref:Alpha-N-acetylglucosaminidase n=1 Tax=Cerrena zonata TaxID=2478898 RepID=A0AAW0GWX2_9APHY